MSTIVVMIGNSDNKLTQMEWAMFCGNVYGCVQETAVRGLGSLHGAWYSSPVSIFQNAAFSFDIDEQSPEGVEARSECEKILRELAKEYKQDSIAILEGETVFLEPATWD